MGFIKARMILSDDSLDNKVVLLWEKVTSI